MGGNVENVTQKLRLFEGIKYIDADLLNQGVPEQVRDTNPNISAEKQPWRVVCRTTLMAACCSATIRVENWDVFDLSFPTADTQSIPPLFSRPRHLALFTFVCKLLLEPFDGHLI